MMVGAFLSSCSPTRKLAEDEYLLVKNSVKIAERKHSIDTDELSGLIRQKPNRRILGFFRFHLQVHNLVNEEKVARRALELEAKNDRRNARRLAKGKDPKDRRRSFGEWLMDIGEEPTILDTGITENSREQLEIYMRSKGYFRALVTDTTVYKKKKAKVVYNIEPGLPYRVRRLVYDIPDLDLRRWILPLSERARIIKSGEPYDTDVLQSERERITRSMRSNGYYAFTDDMVRVEADSSVGNRAVDLRLYLKSDTSGLAGQAVKKAYQEYRIGKVYIHTNYDPKAESALDTDTMIYNGYHLIYKKKFKHRPEVLLSKVFLRTGEIYRIRRAELTYQQLSGLRAFRYINITYQERTDDEGYHLLDTYIQLSPALRQNYAFELEGTNSAGNLGINGSFRYQNKNISRGAEILEFRLTAGLESQVITQGVDNQNIGGLPFNTMEIGPEINLQFPKFLVPFKWKKLSEYANPKSRISVSYNYQQRPDYTRSILNTSFGYSWRENQFKYHELNPFEVNFVNIYNQDPDFLRRIEGLDDQLLQNSFRPHATTTTNYQFLYNNQRINKLQDFSYLKVKLESSGNVLRGIMAASNAKKDTLGNYRILGVPFAQYLKYDIDFRRYVIFNERSELVLRVQHGLGYPLLNLGVLPFESSFFGGGANGIRGWSARSLGPGSLAESDSVSLIDQFGDMKIEFNVEYRFDIYRWFEGAVFVDAGNIWLVKRDAGRPGGLFEFKDFLTEFAVAGGLGLRLDFSFFVIRLDTGIKLHNPAKPKGDRWIRSLSESDIINFNLGIGYPF